MPPMDDEDRTDRAVRLDEESAARRSNVGSLFLVAAFVPVLTQAFGAGTELWPGALAVVLAVIGAGLRIEGVLLRRK